MFDISFTGKDGRVFVSIKSENRQIAENYPLHNNRGVIIDEDGYLQVAENEQMWVDTSGKNYRKK